MSPSVWWAALGVALIAVEMATGTLFVLWFGIGALLTALFAYFFPSDLHQYIFFASSSVLLVVSLRPWVSRLSGKAARGANMDELIGKSGRVEELVDGKSGRGYVKFGGELWRVQTEDASPLKMGAEVEVVSVEGNVLKVKAKAS